MGKFFTLAVMIMTAVSFVSCEKEEVDTNPFVGSWLYKATDFEVKCKFKSDKTFEYSEYKPSSGQGTAYTGRYTYSESSLYLEFQKQNGKEWEFNESRNYYFVDTNTLILDKWTYKKQ
jgi:hypothetical protein